MFSVKVARRPRILIASYCNLRLNHAHLDYSSVYWSPVVTAVTTGLIVFTIITSRRLIHFTVIRLL